MKVRIKGGEGMKKLLIIFSTLCISISLAGCNGGEDVSSAVDDFCQNNSDALICNEEDALRDDIVADMFETVLTEFLDGSNDTFCEDYFSGALIDTCQNEQASLVPDDFDELSSNLEINPTSSTNQYEVLTTYDDGLNAYRFVVDVKEEEGLIKFTSIDYEVIVREVSVTDDEIKQLMVAVINESDDGLNDYCGRYFTADALSLCEGDISNVVGSIYVMYDVVITHVNDVYQYQVKSYDGYDQYTYTMSFVRDSNQNLLISSISYTHEPMYNTLEHSHLLFNDFLDHIKSSYYTVMDACESSMIASDVAVCYDTLKDYNLMLGTIDSYEALVGEDRFEFVVNFDGETVIFQTEVVIDEYHGYFLDIDIVDTVSGPLELTLDYVDLFIEDMYLDYYDGTFQCADYFSGDALSVCENNKDIMFPSFEANIQRIEESSEVGDYIIVPYNWNGEYDGYTKIYPEYFAHISLVDDHFMIDEVILFKELDEIDIDSYVNTFAVDFMSQSYASVDFCYNYGFNATNPFFETQSCQVFRDELMQMDTIEITWYFGPNPYGDIIPILSIDDGETEYLFEFKIEYSYFPSMDLESHDIYGFWYILYDDSSVNVEYDDVVSIGDEIETLLLDQGTSSSDFCTLYPLFDDCITWRDTLLSSEGDTSLVIIEQLSEEGTSYLMEISSNEGVRLLNLDVDVNNQEVVVTSFTEISSGECSACDPQLVIHYFSNKALLELLVEDYNNPLMSDEEVLSKYFNLLNNDLMTLRSSVIDGSYLGLRNIEIVYEEDVFTHAIGVFEYVKNDVIYYVKLYYDAHVVSDEVFDIVVHLIEENQTISLLDAGALYESYLLDYLNPNVSNETLQGYFEEDMSEYLSTRLSFLVAGGERTLLDVSLKDGLFKARYQEILNDTITIYEESFIGYLSNLGEEKLLFNSVEIVEPTLEKANASEGEDLLRQYFVDYLDETISDQAFCDQYHDGQIDCAIYRSRDIVSARFDLLDVVETVVEENQVLEVTYTRSSMLFVKLVTWTIDLHVSNQGTAIIETINYDEEDINHYDGTPIVDDLVDYEDDIIIFFEEYFDETMTTDEFCVKYYDTAFLGDDKDSVINDCKNARNEILGENGDFTLLGMSYAVGEYPNDEPDYALYHFKLVVNGRNASYNTESIAHNDLWIWVDITTNEIVYMYLYNWYERLYLEEDALFTAEVEGALNQYFDETIDNETYFDLYGRLQGNYEKATMRSRLLSDGVLEDYYISYRMAEGLDLLVEVNIFVRMSDGSLEVHRLPFLMVNPTGENYEFRFMYDDEIVDYQMLKERLETFVVDYFDPLLTDNEIYSEYYSYASDVNRASDLTLDLIPSVYHLYINYYYQSYESFEARLILEVDGTYYFVKIIYVTDSNGDQHYKFKIDQTSLFATEVVLP